jgi:phospholipase/lecithinase/hemolysin
MRIGHIRLLALILAAALALPAVAQAAPFSQLVVFGDSLSDNGNVYAVSGQPPSPPYAQRYSNGPVAVEYLATLLGLPPLVPSVPSGGRDYAFGGATTGTANFGSPALPGMAQEVAMYIASLGGAPADPDALYFVWGGPNDVFMALSQSEDPFAALVNADANIGSIVGTLQALGAQHVLVPGMPDLGLAPQFAAIPWLGTALTDFYNGLLQARFANTPVMFYDTAAFMRAVIANPAAYGYTNVVDPCLTMSVCASPDEYFFWDAVHPTTRTHQLFADELQVAVQPSVPEPAALLLLAAGLAVAVRRSARR